MRLTLLMATVAATTFSAAAQYGTFSTTAVKAAKATKTIVVLDAGDSPYNRAMIDAIKADWKFTSAFEFVTTGELAAQPIAPDKTYLLKTAKTDPVKFDATFLTLVQGWKVKKGEVLEQKDNAFTSITPDHELAFIQIDPKAINEKNMNAMVALYVKHLLNYLTLVESGKITDKATADRTYSSRNRTIRDTELWMAQDHLDKSIPDAAKLKESYTAPCQVMALSQLPSAVEKKDKGLTVSDVIITGENKNKHCFKRIFNAGTGELMFLRDDAAIFGKKEGFLDEDLKTIERAR
ncbi:MAG: hypothetical protein JNM62_16500 [Flavobacteriales bacterium]|nr:hypothetical protein [Flavobacteriales bacterium]